jgi:hypothetical protein
MLFCVCCFASEKDASWGGEVIKDHCFNCGASGSPVELEEWQIKSIRQQASWVGKRYYPHEEDNEIHLELKYAREKLPLPKDRTARLVSDSKEDYWVSQPLKNGSNISVTVKARSEEEALQKSKLKLPLI